MRLCCAAFVLLASAGCATLSHPRFELAGAAQLSCRQLEPPGHQSPVWRGPSDPSSRFHLEKWCETVGPVFFEPHPSAAAPAVDRLAIVSWNIHEGRGDVDELVRRLRVGEFTGGEPIDQFVLLLQEATRRGADVPSSIPRGSPSPRRIGGPPGIERGDVQRFADQGLAVFYAPSMRNGEHDGVAEDRGNAIVSTLSLEEPRLIELPFERQRRVVLVATASGRTGKGQSWHLGLVDVHLDTTLALFRGGPFEARRRQAAAVIDALRASPIARDSETATVVAGDFNTWMGRGEAAIASLRGEFPDTPTADSAPTWTGPLGLRARLDHIFVRGGLSPSQITRLPSRLGSDHYPLMTVVHF